MASNINCAVCMSSVEEGSIPNHSCVQNWHSVTINHNSNTFHPTNQNGEYLTRMMLNGEEKLLLIKNVSNLSEQEHIEINDNDVDCEAMQSDEAFNVENISQKTSSISSSSKLDNTILEELLIEEVRKRPPIYDYTLPLAARGRRKIADLWEEISKALDGSMSPEDAKKRWKSLKDTFSKVVAEEKKPSGSARSSSGKVWKHYELMSFLRSVSTHRSSISNITAPRNEYDDKNENNNNNFIEDDSLDNSRKECKDKSLTTRPTKEKSDDVMNRIADALCNKDLPVINMPKLPEMDALDGMFMYIKQRLLKLSSEKQNILLYKFLGDISKEEQN